MKSIIKYLLIVVVAAAACKKDEGNYSYHRADTPVIDTTGMQGTYNIEQLGNLYVAPKVSYEGDTGNLSYQWLVYQKSTSSYVIGPPKQVATKRVLDGQMTLAPGNYYLELVATDKSNNMVSSARFLLNILAYMESGWLVMHSANNETDLDYIATKSILPSAPEKRLRNLFLTNTGAKLKGNGQALGYSRRSNSDYNWITIGTDQELRRVNGFSLTELARDQKLFRRGWQHLIRRRR
ncbi:PKD-like family lipoprotein [Chitinophaga horti]|uniref:PKD-like family lipoprotein n=1 Tax=Chitinophaga horti TaxID=2920382 RepID=A0ABY6JBC3_9BACT|nr:PKD-like family lipoprotein [Chitinophaga horti]UYQ95484.1 PKD-like family lipoprotein [Chitinophaga horti]